MAAIIKKKKKRKKAKYYKFSIKLSQGQKEIIELYCKKRRTTAVKLIKRAVKEFLVRYEKDHPVFNDIGKNQLQINFDESGKAPVAERNYNV